MSIHFAGSRRPARSWLAWHLDPRRGAVACNDNGGANGAALIDTPLLRATLEHFAAHGLGAAARARDLAEAAIGAGDADGYRQWIAVCRTLDRRAAGLRRR